MAHGTFDWQPCPVRRPPPAAAIAPAVASLSFAPLSMTTKPIRFNHCCARGGVFVVLFVVNDEDNTNSFNFAPAAASLSFAQSLMTMKPIQFNNVAPSAASFSFNPSSMTMTPIRFNHVENQHGLPFIGLLQSGDQPRSLSIA